MDKYDLNAIANMLFDELLIGTILYTSSSELTVSIIKNNSVCSMYSEKYITQILSDLVSYGLVVPCINGTINSTFSITAFGTYYFNKLAEENSYFNAIMNKVGGVLNEENGIN